MGGVGEDTDSLRKPIALLGDTRVEFSLMNSLTVSHRTGIVASGCMKRTVVERAEEADVKPAGGGVDSMRHWRKNRSTYLTRQ